MEITLLIIKRRGRRRGEVIHALSITSPVTRHPTALTISKKFIAQGIAKLLSHPWNGHFFLQLDPQYIIAGGRRCRAPTPKPEGVKEIGERNINPTRVLKTWIW